MSVKYGPTSTPNTKDGSSSANAADSAFAIKKLNPNALDGVYWINLPTVGPVQTYCLMDSKWNGGGWMLAMKANSTGTTFNYDSSYWTANNTLNATDLTRNAADAKYDVMNQFPAKDLLAVWPTLGPGGSIPETVTWNWLEKNFNGGLRQNLISFFVSPSGLSYYSGYGGSGYFVRDAKEFDGFGRGVWSSQVDIRFYGFNYRSYQNGPFFQNKLRVRWGFGWNENYENKWPCTYTANGPDAANTANTYLGSNDVTAGIGLDTAAANISAGDIVFCCADQVGANTQLRVELFVR